MLSGCGSAASSAGSPSSDVLSQVTASAQVGDGDRAACDKAMGNPPSSVKLTGTVRSPFKDVKAAMVARFGQAKADAAAPQLSDDTQVTLCAFDTSGLAATPPVDRMVLAIGGGSSWWADGSLG
jgi:hypothetical protein